MLGAVDCCSTAPTPDLLPVPCSGALTGVLTLTYMSLMVRGNWSTRGKPTQAQGEHANSTQKGPEFEPRTFLLRGNSAYR